VGRAALPLLSAALSFVGHDAIRTRGTIGGSIAHGDPAAEMPTVARTLDATLQVTSAAGTREIDAESFFHGFLMTSLEPDELLTAIEFPIPGDRCGWSFNEVSRRSGDFALVGCAVMVELASDGTVDAARIGLSGVAEVPFRAGAAEALVQGATPDDALFDLAADAAGGEVAPTSDLHGTAEYRRHLTRGLVRNGLRQAVERANGVS
jgi:carbon-monoxide dehydrogenase medium subunit